MKYAVDVAYGEPIPRGFMAFAITEENGRFVVHCKRKLTEKPMKKKPKRKPKY